MSLKLLIALMLSAALLIGASSLPRGGSDTGADYVKWFNHYLNDWTDFEFTCTQDAFPDAVFIADPYCIKLQRGEITQTLVFGMPVWNAYFADLNGDGFPELLASVAFGSGMIDEHIVVCDIVNDRSYTLWDRGVFDYVLTDDGGVLSVRRSEYNTPYMSGEYPKGVRGYLRLTKNEPAALLFEER